MAAKRLARRRWWLVAVSLALLLTLSACAGPFSAQTPAATPVVQASAITEVRVRVSQSILSPGATSELIAEGRAPGGEWREVRALWRAEPAHLGVLEVPPQQREGLSRTWYTAKTGGQVTVVAEVAGGNAWGAATLAIAGVPSPTAVPTVIPPTPRPTRTQGVGATPTLRGLVTRTPRPTPNVQDSPAMRAAIVELDRLDRQVLAVADTFVGAFRAYADKRATQAQMCESIAYSVPKMEATLAAEKAFVAPPALQSVHAKYVGVAEDLRCGLLALDAFCRGGDQSQIKTYVDRVAGAIANSAFAKLELDEIALAIGAPIPRSTRVATPTKAP